MVFRRGYAWTPLGELTTLPQTLYSAGEGDTEGAPHSPPLGRLRRFDPSRLELHAFGVSGSTLAIRAPLLARLGAGAAASAGIGRITPDASPPYGSGRRSNGSLLLRPSVSSLLV